ncbi:hypothetical protein Glove_17g47 [Diversispora epigaea]|uniref:Uncharacterized protein n=1 Tax=Diversispora epigaea TaxID=1348612 RepID=A0A397JVG4_9GLOM|nr:hypothetical protein Glove_17g47 [Diversispora epigaea]
MTVLIKLSNLSGSGSKNGNTRLNDFIFSRYIYGEIVDLENCETRFIYDLMLAADEFELEELTNKLEILIIEIKDSSLRTHFSFIFILFLVETTLKNFCNDIVVKCPKLIFDSLNFSSLEESSIVSLLKRDNLQIEENLGLVIPIKIPLKLPVFKSKENELLTLEGIFLNILLEHLPPLLELSHSTQIIENLRCLSRQKMESPACRFSLMFYNYNNYSG